MINLLSYTNIIHYKVAQFYHKFSVTDSGYDSTFNTSFKYSSSEEDSPKIMENIGKRRGNSAYHNGDWKKRRPIGMGQFRYSYLLNLVLFHQL